jgi:hypothetical protein
VTFICSKTDDISITEAADTLGLDEEIHESFEESIRLQREIRDLKRDDAELLQSRELYADVLDDIQNQMETWRDLESKVESGDVAYAPREKKRKRKSDHKQRNKNFSSQRDSDSDSDSVSVSDGDSAGSDSDSDSDKEIEIRVPLSEEQVREKLSELKEQKNETKRQKEVVVNRRKEAGVSLRSAKVKLEELQSEMSAVCITGRNQYSKTAIQHDFAAGIKELDQENAIEVDEMAFNPDEDLRNYDVIAQSLPVFCVSSRAYQKLSGRLQKDSAVSGFTSPEQTQIPQLQDHCRKITERGRVAASQTFLNNLNQLLNSLSLWALNDGTGSSLTAAEREDQANFLQDQIGNLERVHYQIDFLQPK